jgi:anti-anti-sigma regulatory factor
MSEYSNGRSQLPGGTDLSANDQQGLLGSSRRRQILDILDDQSAPVVLDDLVAEVAERVTGRDPVDEETVIELIESQGQVDSFDTELVTNRGGSVDVRITATADDDQIRGFVREVTTRKELERKTEEQAKAILEVEIPVVQVWDGVTLATVVGALDTNRAQRLTEELLTSLMHDKSEVAILDITGVGTIDTATAQHLIETVNAVTLLGSEVVITGINPDIAQTMVNLNITMDDIRTKASLADGLKLARKLLRAEKKDMQQIIMITDGKPTCIRKGKNYYKNAFGLDRKIVNRTLNLARQCRKLQIPVTTFMIASDPYLQRFVDQFTRANNGRAFYSSLKGLGEFIFKDYQRGKRKRF